MRFAGGAAEASSGAGRDAPTVCSGMSPSGSVLVRGGGRSTVAADYNANNLGKRVAVARPKQTMGDATPEDGN